MSFEHFVQTGLKASEFARYVTVEADYVHQEANGWKRWEKMTFIFSLSRHQGRAGRVAFATQGMLRMLRGQPQQLVQAMQLHGRAAFVEGPVLRQGCLLSAVLGRCFHWVQKKRLLLTAFHWSGRDDVEQATVL